MAHLSLCLLGQLQVKLDGEAVLRFRGDTARALLAYLAVHPGTAFARAQLAALLWPDHPEDVALQNLRQALRRLRTAIGDAEADPPFLLATRATIAMNPEGDYSCDVTAFAEAVAASKAHRHRRLAECPACIGRLESAAALYRGEFLAGFSLDSALFEEWMVVEREHLHGQALEVLETLAAYHEGREAYEQALGYARRQIEMEGWREGAHRQAMRALALSGDRAGALAQYEACCRALGEELGIEPEAETRGLYERVRDGAELRPVSPAAPHNLPLSPTPFIGREEALAEIAQQLGDAECRLLTLVGPGGIGKTRLALEVGRRQLGHHQDGVFFVSLAPVETVEAVAPTLAQAIGFSFYEGGEPRQQLLDYLRRKRMLLVLDNYEHLVEDVGLVTDLLREAPEVRMVVTSRERLNVQGEHVYAVEGMRYSAGWSGVRDLGASPRAARTSPSSVSPLRSEDAARYSAVRLFVSSAQRVAPVFEPSVEVLAEVARLCRLVEGMPLAIELAASWVDVLSPAEIAGEIAGDLGFLDAELRDVPARHRSVRAAFDGSWRLLSEGEQEALAALSLFRGGFVREAAEAVAGADLRVLGALARKSLVRRSRDGRYELHELLRQYCAEKLAQMPGEEAVRDRHAAHYAAALARWAADLKSGRMPVALAEMDAEIENARAAWNWMAARGQVAHMDRAMEGLWYFYALRWRSQEGEAAFRETAERLTAMGERPVDGGQSRPSSLAMRVLIRTLGWQSQFHRDQGCWEHARQCLERAQALLEGPDLAGQDVRWERALILGQMGHLNIQDFSGHELDRVVRLFEQSLALFQETGDQWWAGGNLRTLGLRYARLGQYDKGRRAIEESRAIFQALGDPHMSARAAMYLARFYLGQGLFEQAERWAREGLSAYRELGDRPDPMEMGWLGWTLLGTGAYLEAQSLMEEYLAISSDLGIRRSGLFTVLGWTELHLGHYGRARTLAKEALVVARERESRQNTMSPLWLLGCVALVEGAPTEARQWLDECMALCREQATQRNTGFTHSYLGYVAREEGAINHAWHHVYRALQIGAALGDRWPRTIALPLLALLLADRGEAARAVELYALASRHPYVANSRWFEDVVGRHIAAAAATLPPEEVAVAQERGRARDLEATVVELLAELEEQQGSDVG